MFPPSSMSPPIASFNSMSIYVVLDLTIWSCARSHAVAGPSNAEFPGAQYQQQPIATLPSTPLPATVPHSVVPATVGFTKLVLGFHYLSFTS